MYIAITISISTDENKSIKRNKFSVKANLSASIFQSEFIYISNSTICI